MELSDMQHVLSTASGVVTLQYLLALYNMPQTLQHALKLQQVV